jgi:hypothetical protein
VRALSRRGVLGLAAGAAAALATRPAARASGPRDWTTIRHDDVVDGVRQASEKSFLDEFAQLMVRTARRCVVDAGGWTVPSPIYGDMYARDAFWIGMAIGERGLSQAIVDQFRDDQVRNPDGHAATFLSHTLPKIKETDRPDESTAIYVLHAHHLWQMGGEIDRGSLGGAYRYLAEQTHEGWFVTRGEWRPPGWPTGIDDRGCFHYWADTYRPAAKPEQKPEVFAYSQGLVAVAMRCLERMGVAVDGHLVRGVEHAYATMTSPHDYATLPQRAGAAILDVSSLAGEALSLHWFDRSLLGPGRVVATLRAFKRCEHRDGEFLGFRVISNPDGGCRPDEEFIVPISNPPGYYHNGGSWLLYDALALYVAARHGIEGAPDLFVQRLRSEVKYEQESHEYLSTSPDQLGQGEPRRARYGWNSFVWRLFT